MSKRYDHRLVRSYISYSIAEICRLYKVNKLHPQTVRGWIIFDGLEANQDGHKILIYGAVLKQFLSDRNKGRKRTLKMDELYCCKCRAINSPVQNTITSLMEQPNGCLLAKGICPDCGFMMQRMYKRIVALDIRDLFKFDATALMLISDISCTTYKTHLQNDPKLAICESSGSEFSCQPNSSLNHTPANNHSTNGDHHAED
jgi:hypothetical protein